MKSNDPTLYKDAPESEMTTRLAPDEESDVQKMIALEQARVHLENRIMGGLKAYVVGLEKLDDDAESVREGLEEIAALVRSLGDDCVGLTVQKRARVTPATYIGSGKALEVKERCLELQADYVVFDQELSGGQVRNLEKIIEKPVLDRTTIILQIFRKNARTKEAQTQVEIAQLEYLAPRLQNSWIAFERQRGGMKLKGAGETQIELDRRRLKERIYQLKKELVKIQKERVVQRRHRLDTPTVVLVGYTNAGKTTVMNALTDSHLVARDALFETLDSSVRTLKNSHHTKVLVIDTVGFIKDLPHGLVASFRSTLEECVHADLLVHVVDVSHPRFRDRINVTNQVLHDIGAAEVPQLVVFNKIDSLKNEPRLPAILRKTFPQSITVSAYNSEDIEKLREHVIGVFSEGFMECSLVLPYEDSRLLGIVYGQTKVLESHPLDHGIEFKLRMSKALHEKCFAKAPLAPEDSSDV